MADFLTRMTQRTLGLLPVVQPIIASKYGSESMGADMPGGLPSIDPGQVGEESFEDWEGGMERVPPAPRPQPVVPRGVRIPAAPLPGMPPSAASPQEQPAPPKVQQTKQAPIRPHEVQPLRETTGGPLPSPLVPQPQDPSVRKPGRDMPQGSELPGRGKVGQAKGGKPAPLSYTNPNPDPYRPILEPGLEMPQGAELPGRGQAPPLPYTGRGWDSYRVGAGLAPALAIQENQPFSSAPTASNVPATKPHRGQGKPSSRSDVGTRFIASRTDEPLVPAQSAEVPHMPKMPHASTHAASHNEANPVRQYPYVSSFNIESPTLISSSSPISANSYRVRAGLAPALASPVRLASPGELAPALVSPIGSPALASPGELAPALVPVRSATMLPAPLPSLVAESDLIEPGFPSIYPSVQTRRAGTTTARRISAAQLSESHESPTIRVTIGRIDVRAVPPTPPASPTPTKSNRPRPALSLSDYLKQRKGGQR